MMLYKRFTVCSLLFAICAASSASAAPVAIRKADAVPVQKKEAAGMMEGNSLVPAAIGLISGVMALNQQMKGLVGDCVPTTAEIDFVSKMVKEQAMAGKDFRPFVDSRGKCEGNDNDYKVRAQNAANTPGLKPCVVVLTGPGNDGMIWAGAPKVSKASICKKNGGVGCTAKDEEVVSDIYDIFPLIEFGNADWKSDEASMAATVEEKHDRCSDVKLAAKKRELFGGFIMQTAGSLGQKQDLQGVMGAVGGIMQSGGGSPMGTIMGLAPALTQGLMK